MDYEDQLKLRRNGNGAVGHYRHFFNQPKTTSNGKEKTKRAQKTNGAPRIQGIIDLLNHGYDVVPDPNVNRVIYGGQDLVENTNLVALFKRNKYQINPIARRYLKDDYNISPLTARRAVVYGLERIKLDEKAKGKLEEEMQRYGISSTIGLRLREVRE